MQTQLAEPFRDTAAGKEADSILRKCVHCGFCTATCPTYRLLGDELDGPRGRIYLIKEMLEGSLPTRKTQLHLDRCLTCRSCETTCPSGVRYGRLLDIGRQQLEQVVPRTAREQFIRRLLLAVIPFRRRFAAVLALGRMLRPVLFGKLRHSVPAWRSPGPWPAARHTRRMLVLEGCVQPSAAPSINAAAARVLDRIGISLIRVDDGCCGAVAHHLSAEEQARAQMRRNIDAWWPEIERGAEAVIVTASGCGAMVREYGTLLQDDPAYGAKAARISELFRDLSQVVAQELGEADLHAVAPALGDADLHAVAPGLRDAELHAAAPSLDTSSAAGSPSPTPTVSAHSHAGTHGQRSVQRIAFHSPCTLQHGLQIRGVVELLLRRAGFTLLPVADGHLCCGSAGTYSILQPELSRQLKANKLAALEAQQPDLIATANIGCLMHLASGTGRPVRHWIELLDARLAGTR